MHITGTRQIKHHDGHRAWLEKEPEQSSMYAESSVEIEKQEEQEIKDKPIAL